MLASIIFPNGSVVRGAAAQGAETSTLPSSHWAYPVMDKWLKLGLLNGNGKDPYMPDNPITRAELVVFLNRVFKFTQAGEHPFKDVATGAWYAEDIAMIYRAGIIKGVSQSKFEPQSLVTREDAAVMIARAFKLAAGNQGTSSFKDEDRISAYAMEAVNAMYDKGYVKGRGDQKFSPKSRISRAEFMQLLDNVMGTLIQKAGSYTSDVPGNLVINTEGVVLKNLVIHGDLFITQGAGQGEIKLDGVTVLGRTYLWGGSEISVTNSTLQGALIVDKWDSQIHIVTSGSQISDTQWISSGKMEEQEPGATPTSGSETSAPGSGGGSGSTSTPAPTSTPEPTETPGPTDKLVIVQNGNPVASVVISGDADARTKTAAEDLIKYVKKSTGAQLPLLVDESKSVKVTAENGVIRVTYSEELSSVPVASDYRITMKINEIPESASIRPTSVAWNVETKTVTLNVPPLAAIGIPQNVVYKIIYKNTLPIQSGVIAIAADPGAPLNLNSSFETQYGVEDAQPWRFWVDGSGKSIKLRSNEQARSGSYSLKASGVPAAWPNQEVNLTHYGDYEYTAYFLRPLSVTTNGTIRVFIELLDSSGAIVRTLFGDLTNANTSSDTWMELKWEGEIPEQINGQTVVTARIGLTLENFAGNEHVFIDDARLVMKNPPATTPDSGDSPSDLENQPPVSIEPELEAAQTLIYVGKFGLSPQEQITLMDDLGNDGFVIHQNGKKITIAGPTPAGTDFGVSEFLERYVGVLWLMPTEDWEDVPQHTVLSVPIGDEIKQNPAFFSSTFEAIDDSVREEWKRRNRTHWRVDFTHNLDNLLPPWKYKDTHPEFYPPGADLSNHMAWQPCFKAPGIVEESIANIIAYFDANPEATSYPVGINDTRSFCESDLQGQTPKLNSIGMVDYSNVYFEWLQQVAEGVFEKYPDKKLGTYAYYNTYDAPTNNIKLDSRIVVYLTDDRLSWTEEQLRQEGHDLTDSWLATGATIGFYEYLYGTSYTVPRVYNHQMAEIYRYAADKGVKAYYAELYPNFGEGPKPWLSTKLQWNPYQDEDALLDQWYERAVGASAAPDLKAYYDMWQKFWEQDYIHTKHYESWRNGSSRTNFMNLFSASYLAEISPEYFTESRRLLESVRDKAETSIQKKRAQDLLTMYEYYELSYLSYPDPNETINPPVNEDEAMALLNDAVQKIQRMEARMQLSKDFESNTLYYHQLAALDWGVVSNEQTLTLARWMSEHPDGATQVKVDELFNAADSPARLKDFINNLIAATYGTQLRNGGFEEGMLGWHDWPDTVAELTSDANSGSWALKVNVSSREQTVFLESGKTYQLTFYAKVTGSSSETNLLGINFWDVPGVGLQSALVTVDSSEYKKYVLRFEAPAKFSHATIVIYKDRGNGWVYADDFTLKEWNPGDEMLLSSATAVNGIITASMTPATVGADPGAPLAQDFDVTTVVNGARTASVHPTEVSWDAATKTATLTVSAIAASTTGQSVKYELSYQGGAVFESGTINIAADPQAPLNRNGSFEFGYAVPNGDNIALSWKFVLGGVDSIRELSKERAKTGSYSFKASGAPAAWPVQDIGLTGYGQYAYTAFFLRPASVSTNGTIKLFFYLLDANGQIIDTKFGDEVHVNESSEVWTELKWEGEIPSQVNGQQVVSATIGLALEQFAGSEHVFIDDVQFVKMPEMLLSNVTADNGVIAATMSSSGTAPLAQDFDVTAVVDGIRTTSVHPTEVSWDAGTKTATLTVSAVETSTTGRSVKYELSYQGGVVLESGTINIAADPQAPLNRNGSFEFGYAVPNGDDIALSWQFVLGGDGSIRELSKERAKTGSYSFKASGAPAAWPVQDIGLTGYGQYAYTAYFLRPASVSTNGTIKLFFYLLDANGQIIDTKFGDEIHVNESSDVWTELKWEGEIPSQVNGQQVVSARIGLALEHFAGSEHVFIDDVQFVKVTG